MGAAGVLYPPEGAAGRGAGRRYPEFDCLLGLNSPNISKVIGTATVSITRHDAKITWKNKNGYCEFIFWFFIPLKVKKNIRLMKS